ncbi:peptidase [Desulfofundulus thermobenzoicus]|uniref:Peptidase n=1 Tax=Desulfofundulus thermobenzoicus TaxID=29376 RepID=A0A6N7INY5_9FIRM|nr:PepSY domain-containing protein [Desulfofundulus thermobenzoicus]MQL51650.1 peptidase [Desulfofundulus thermobenzoicus]HHW42414.1 peptidase [Desulfotomaculum sp.]
MKVNKKALACVASGMLLLGAATGLGAYQARAAQTAAPTGQPAAVVSQSGSQQQQNEQKPAYTSSIQMPDTGNDNTEKGRDNEAAENASLQSLAKISAEQAKSSALKAVAGKVTGVSLDNENGNVVYSVEIQTAKGLTDVKVDAGNGQVLAQETGEDDHGNQAHEVEKGATGTDNDGEQLEQ